MAEETPAAATPSEDADRLSPAEQQRVQEWYKRVAPQGAECPICKSKEWAVLDHFVMPVAVSGAERSSIMLGGPAYVQFMLACKVCGNTQFINAFQSGVLPVREAGEKK